MIALDTNVLIYLLVSSEKEHLRAVDWFNSVEDNLAITSTNIAEFLRLVTHPKLFSSPLDLTQAVELITSFVEDFDVTVLNENEFWWKELPDIAESVPSLRGNDIFDLRIVLCLKEHRVKHVCTLDSGFSRFPFVKVISF